MVRLSATMALVATAISSVNAAGWPTWPTPTGSVTFTAPYVVAAGTTFDGGMKRYDRSDVKCVGQQEGGSSTAVFLVMPGATLKNVIIGPNQMEGVHCDKHDCVLQNVWWEDVCEDAFSVKGGSATSVTKVIGGGARYADDKVIQHNGGGTVEISNFYAQDFGKLYRSCGTCGNVRRSVTLTDIYAVDPKVSIATVNVNFGDSATFKNINVKTTKNKEVVVCGWSGGGSGGEPTKLGSGPKPGVCNYSAADIHINNATTGPTSAPATVKPAVPVATTAKPTTPAATTKPATPVTPKPTTTKPTKTPKPPKPTKTPKVKKSKKTKKAKKD